MKKLIALSAALCAALICCAGCQNNSSEYSTESKTFFNMDTSATILVTDNFNDKSNKEKYNALCADVEKTLNDIENSVSAHKEGSCIYEFNRENAGAKVEIDQTAYELLTTALNVYNKTDGYYNPAVYYSVYDYGFYGLFGFMTEAALPSDEAVASYTSLASHFGEIELSQDNGKYYAKKPAQTVEVDGETLSMKIDLGGIGKGYATDKVNALFSEYGFENGFFNFASSSIAIKKHYINGGYSLNFTSPRAGADGSSYLVTKIQDKCVSTSGDYEMYYELGGVRYCHIIDPTTGKPVQTGIMTVTVIGGSAAEDDALTTAVMCMGKDGAINFINQNLSDREVVFTYDNGGEYEAYTNIPAERYTVINKNYTVKELK
ncbi:MAG: FAD:protein FMN transferase [Clostridia bacterium]|nr:FAD:protein FMN transferase [Clostridia bacterium]